jgi:hypothetical protein
MSRISIILILLVVSFLTVTAQQKDVLFDLSSSAGYITHDQVPFWLRSKQFGSIPLDNGSLSFISGLHKGYQKSKPKLIDWGFSFIGRANIGHRLNFSLIEGYGNIRISIFEIRAGRSKEIMGLCDTT